MQLLLALLALSSCWSSLTTAQRVSHGDLGIDVSSWQGSIQWSKVARAGVKFAIVKATEGARFVDRTFQTNFNGAKAAGLRTGFYHYFRMSATVEQQLMNIRRAMAMVKFDRKSDLIAVDFETTASDPGLHGAKNLAQRRVISAKLFSLLEQIRTKLHVRPLLYSNPNSINTLLDVNYRQFSNYNLWIAHYTQAARPIVPKPWLNYLIWQRTDRGRVNGISGNVDLNRAGQSF